MLVVLIESLHFIPAEFFKLMNEVENEDLVFTLETIVDKFGEEMAPYALGLCQNLVLHALIIIPKYSYMRLCYLCMGFSMLATFSGCCILEVYEYC